MRKPEKNLESWLDGARCLGNSRPYNRGLLSDNDGLHKPWKVKAGDF